MSNTGPYFKIVRAFARLAAIVLISGCSAQNAGTGAMTGAPASSLSTCVPAPLPTPSATLVSPRNGASGVPKSTDTVTFQVQNASATSVSLTSTTETALTSSQVVAQGPPSPTGDSTYLASFTGQLAANTTYSVLVSGQQTFGSCPQNYTSPAGSFTTGS